MLKIIKRIYEMAGNQKQKLILSMILSLFEGITIFIPYLLIFYSINEYINNSLDLNTIKTISIIMAISILFRIIFRRIIDALQSTAGCTIFANQRLKFVNHIKKLPMGYFSEDKMGHIVSILTTDIIFCEEIAMTFLGQLTSAYINIIISTVFMFFINTYLGIIYLIIMTIAYFTIGYFDRANAKYGKIRQDQFGVLSNAVVEYIKGISTIKAFNIDETKNKKLQKEFETTKNNSIKYERAYVVPRIVSDSTYTLGTAFMIFASLILFNKNLISKELILGILIFSSIALNTINAIITGVPRFRILEASLKRFDEVMNEKELTDKMDNTTLKSNDIEFKNVSFAYDSEEILKNVSFKIKEKTTTALVGPSGGGKSTISNLIARFWDIQKGEIIIGGKNIKEIPQKTLLSSISMVFQNVYLFEDTIFNNIAFGMENPSMAEVIEAAKKAKCHDFITKLPRGYDTVISEGGQNFSGGEKQRISIARAILKDAPIILLDEATSSVDPENEIFIQEAIRNLVKNKTLIVIAHRLSSIKNVDKILYIENGKLEEQGTHNQLISKKGGKYKQMIDYYCI